MLLGCYINYIPCQIKTCHSMRSENELMKKNRGNYVRKYIEYIAINKVIFFMRFVKEQRGYKNDNKSSKNKNASREHYFLLT